MVPPRLFLRPLDRTTAVVLPGSDGASYPFWSPDSRAIAFFADNKLKRIDIGAGSPVTLTNVSAGRGGTWSKDGVILFAPNVFGPLQRIAGSGGEPSNLPSLGPRNRFPQFLPDGQQFLFYAQGQPDSAGIYLGSLASDLTKRLTPADTNGFYMPGGWLIWIRGTTLVAQHLDLERKELTGNVIPIADEISVDNGFYVGAFSVSNAGLIAYRVGNLSRRGLGWFDRAGKFLGWLGMPDENNLNAPRLSPDGQRVTAYRTIQGNYDIWVFDADRTTRFTFDASLDRWPTWSSDGTRILFDSTRKGRRDIYQKLSSGAGTEEIIVESAQDKTVSDESTDGRYILYHSSDPQTNNDIWVLPTEGDRKPFVFRRTNYDERRAQFSPDGHWVAYMSNESGRHEIYVSPFPGPGGQWQISTAGGISPRWSSTGKELYYIAPDATLMAAAIDAKSATLEPGRPVALFRARIYGAGTDINVGTNYDVARDGRFLINTVLEDVTSTPITLLQNWSPLAK